MPNLIEIVISGKNEAKAAMDEAKADSLGLGATMSKIGGVSALALAGIGVEATKMATSYETSTTRLVTSAGETTQNIDMVRKGMLAMAGQVGISAIDLSKGMYTVESAGYHGAEGLTVLKAAAQGAKDEGADLGTVANAVTDVLVDYHLKASDAAKVTSQMVTAVSFGKTTFQDFSGAMHNILPLASAMHLSFQDVSGVLAEMTAHGMSADQASQNMANAMRSLIAPTSKQAAEFKALGISSEEVRDKLSTVGLAGTMEFLAETAKTVGPNVLEQEAALKKLMGTAPGLSVALMTTGENADATSKAITGIGAATADAQGNVKGFAEIQQTLGQKVAELKAGFDTLMIELGQKIIPIVKDVIDWFGHHKIAVEALAVSVGVVLVGAMISFAQTATTKVLGAVEKVITGFANMGTAAEGAAAKEAAAAESTATWSTKLGGAIPVIGGVIAGAAILGNKLDNIFNSAHSAALSVDVLTTAMEKNSSNVADLGPNVDGASKALAELGMKSSNVTDPIAALGVGLGETSQKLHTGSDALANYDGTLARLVSSGSADRAKQIMDEISAATDGQGKTLINTARDFPEYFKALDALSANQALTASNTKSATDALTGNNTQQQANANSANALAKSQDGVANAQNGLADSTSQMTSTWDAAKKAASDYSNQLDGLFGRFASYSDAQAALTIALSDATGKIQSGTDAVNLNSLAGAKNFQELDKLSKANMDVAKNMLQTGSTSDEATDALRRGARAIDDLAQKSGFTRDQIDKLNSELYGVPKLEDITITADTGPAASALADLGQKIAGTAIKMGQLAKTATDTSQLGYAHGGEIGSAATGGIRSGFTLVGEHGPELVRLPTGSTVRSNPDTMAAFGSARGGGGTVQLEWVGPEGDELFTYIKRWIRVGYGNDPNSVQKALGQTY